MERQRQKILLVFDHSYSWVRTKEPTTSSEGVEEYKCSVCGNLKETRGVAKLPDVGQETDWVYSGDTRTKTMYDGTVVTENKYGTVLCYFDDRAARDMFAEIQKMQKQAYGDADVSPWDDSKVYDAETETLNYAYYGNTSTYFHMNSGGLPNVSNNRQYITFVNLDGCSTALACFVKDRVLNEALLIYLSFT